LLSCWTIGGLIASCASLANAGRSQCPTVSQVERRAEPTRSRGGWFFPIAQLLSIATAAAAVVFTSSSSGAPDFPSSAFRGGLLVFHYRRGELIAKKEAPIRRLPFQRNERAAQRRGIC